MTMPDGRRHMAGRHKKPISFTGAIQYHGASQLSDDAGSMTLRDTVGRFSPAAASKSMPHDMPLPDEYITMIISGLPRLSLLSAARHALL